MVKIALGSIGDSFSVGSVKSYVSEFIATLLFVFAGVGSAIAYSKQYSYVFYLNYGVIGTLLRSSLYTQIFIYMSFKENIK